LFRRLRVVATLVAALALFLPANPVSAYHGIPSCTKDTGTKWVEDTYLPSSGNAFGTEVQIDPSADSSSTTWFGPCYWESVPEAGVGMYTGLQSTIKTNHWVTLGVIRCYGGGAAWLANIQCSNGLYPPRPSLRYYIGIGLCGGGAQYFDLDFSNATYDNQTLEIDRVSGTPTQFRFYVNGVQRYAINFTDDRIDCWASDTKRIITRGQIIDDGDSLGKGDSSTNKSLIWNFRVRPAGGSWATYSPQCTYLGTSVVHPLQCSTNVNAMYLWSGNAP
jgi:hypothetical protein